MRQKRLQPLVWPVAVLIAAALAALIADATAQSVQTVTLYGLIKMTSDLLLLIGGVWMVLGVVQVLTSASRR